LWGQGKPRWLSQFSVQLKSVPPSKVPMHPLFPQSRADYHEYRDVWLPLQQEIFCTLHFGVVVGYPGGTLFFPPCALLFSLPPLQFPFVPPQITLIGGVFFNTLGTIHTLPDSRPLCLLSVAGHTNENPHPCLPQRFSTIDNRDLFFAGPRPYSPTQLAGPPCSEVGLFLFSHWSTKQQYRYGGGGKTRF